MVIAFVVSPVFTVGEYSWFMDETTFPAFNETKVLHSHVQGPSDPEASRFTMISMAPIFRDGEVREEAAEAEYIDSYLNCLKAASAAALAQMEGTDSLERLFQPEYLTALPLLFLSRHIVELSLKSVIRTSHHKVKKSHKLMGLWNDAASACKSVLPSNEYESVKEFIEFLGHLDPRGTAFRYSPPQDNREPELVWLDSAQLTSYTEALVDIFRLNNLIPVNHTGEYMAKRLDSGDYVLSSKEEYDSKRLIPATAVTFKLREQ